MAESSENKTGSGPAPAAGSVAGRVVETGIRPLAPASDAVATQALIDELVKLQESRGVRRNTFVVDGQTSVDGWKFNEWDFGGKRSLPIHARGLFTVGGTAAAGAEAVAPEIAVRGYDKFFNVGENPQTSWSWIDAHTRGPYQITQKENGCIILVSGLANGQLLVCSKHSTGFRETSRVQHSLKGEDWLERHLARSGHTKQDLAATLRHLNCTAALELCDDELEEHILPYKGEDRGLYLHGMNVNSREFVTYPFADVERLAAVFGFRPIKYVSRNTAADLRRFLEQCAETGGWDGRDVEGFVVRCKAELGGRVGDFLFKYKFDEPYFMYRQWRELTKALIEGKETKIKKHHKITTEYLRFVRDVIRREPAVGEAFLQNQGIIELRDRFLAAAGKKGLELIEGEDAAEEERLAAESGRVTDGTRFVVVPVATIGCGKTTLGLTLAELYGWGHVQNDNVTGKGASLRFVEQIKAALGDHRVVFADRNNHQARERRQIFDDLSRIAPLLDVRYVCVQFVHRAADIAAIRQTTASRVFDRGDNHQSIQAATMPKAKIMGIMNGFISRFQAVNTAFGPDKDIFDLVVDLKVGDKLQTSVLRVVDAIEAKYGVLGGRPAPAALESAMIHALNYQPTTRKGVRGLKAAEADGRRPKDGAKVQRTLDSRPAYFELPVPRQPFLGWVEAALAAADAPPSGLAFYRRLEAAGRVQAAFHVTVEHVNQTKKGSAEQKAAALAAWNALMVQHKAGVLAHADVRVLDVVWDDRVMCAAVDVVGAVPRSPLKRMHVTVGTARPDIAPVESNALLELRAAGADAIASAPVRGAVLAALPVRAVF
ncbi:RNA ligase-domain-containing protein [Dipodascopsis tothii]|uniref:RNA ligase-domain-containing protein n=1 Tax=Dipodascopsis tothii TaxID=44089 RepID=UPI0034CD96FE